MENKQVVNKKQQEMATLGDGNVFIKRTPTGAIKAIRGKVRLEERKGHVAVIQGKAMITSAGYNAMNQFAGISIITPEKLTLPDGNMVVNPYPIIDPESGTIDKVWVKKTAIGYSPTGNLVMTSSTLLYDIKMYFIQDLNKKVQYNKGAGRMCMEQMLTEEEKQKGMFLAIQGKMGIWVDLTHQEILKCMDTYIQNKLFAERKAQTIAERNALKKHPALCQVYVDTQGTDKNKVGFVNVIGFNSDLTREDLLKLSEMAEKGEEIKDYKGKKIEYIDANIIDEISEEDIYTTRDEEEITPENEHGTAPTHQPIQEKVNKVEDPEEINSLKNDLEAAKDLIGADRFTQIIQDNFKKEYKDLTGGQLKMAKTLINAAMDNEGVF